ncbi:MAG: hypothetical protein WEA04_02425 [Candidatus Andersenbacteria bacterium]
MTSKIFTVHRRTNTGEVYIFRYNKENHNAVVRALGQCASSPHLSFTWYDAALLNVEIRKQLQENLLPNNRLVGS